MIFLLPGPATFLLVYALRSCLRHLKITTIFGGCSLRYNTGCRNGFSTAKSDFSGCKGDQAVGFSNLRIVDESLVKLGSPWLWCTRRWRRHFQMLRRGADSQILLLWFLLGHSSACLILCEFLSPRVVLFCYSFGNSLCS